MADLLASFGVDGAAGDCIVSEANGFRSRDQVLIAPNTTVKPNDMLGKITATGFHTPLAPAASDGSQTAVCIAIDGIVTGAAAGRLATFARDGEFNASEVGPSSLTANQKKAAFAQLATKGLIASASIADPTLARPTP